MEYNTILKQARKTIGPNCKACIICNGMACRGVIPGPGGRGTGSGFYHSYNQLKKIKLNMNTIYTKDKDVDTSIELFGKTFDYPIFLGPIGGVQSHYSNEYNERAYLTEVFKGCAEANIIGFTGDGLDSEVFDTSLEVMKEYSGIGVPTIKPWEVAVFKEKLKRAEEANAFAIAMDIDAGGLLFKGSGQEVSPKNVDELKSMIEGIRLPFIIKGIMTVKGALDALEAGASAIVVSNHGGRVFDETPATIDVLEDIVKAVDKRMKVFVDGGFRTGGDVLKALAIGADAVLIARPFAVSVYGGGSEGVTSYAQMIGQELKAAMTMVGALNLADVNRTMCS